MNDDPLLVGAMIAVAAFLFHLWWRDLGAARAGRPNPRAFPGAVPCERQILLIAIAGTLLLLALETGGEAVLGIADQQSTVTVLWSLYSLAAAFIEELTFRGYLAVTNRGRTLLWSSIVLFSALFALAHPFLWRWEEGHLVLQLTAKGWFSTALAFAGSLWFYTLRFAPFNPGRSLLPCIVGHLTKNLGVFALKGAAGFVCGWY